MTTIFQFTFVRVVVLVMSLVWPVHRAQISAQEARDTEMRNVKTLDVKFLLRKLASSDPHERCSAAEQLGSLGPGSKAAIPALVGALIDVPTVRNAVGSALQRIGDEAIPELLRALKEGNPKMRRLAMAELVTMKAVRHEQALKAFMAAINDSDDELVNMALGALVRDGPRPKALIPVLRALLKQNSLSPDLRRAVIMDLGTYGADAKIAVPDLFKILRKRSDPLRADAAESIWRIDRTNEEMIAAMDVELRDKNGDARMRATAARILGQFSQRANMTIPVLFEILDQTKQAKREDVTYDLRKSALHALASLKPEKMTSPRFLAILKDDQEDLTIRLDALQAIIHIGPCETVIRGFVQILEKREPGCRFLHRTIIVELGRLGSKAKEAIPVLEYIEANESAYLAEPSKKALNQIR